jgi:uncharacterized membrane protein (DUF2068 family)
MGHSTAHRDRGGVSSTVRVARVSDPPKPSAAPPPLTVAASLVAIQGFVLVALAVVEIADLDADRRAMGLSTAGFFAGYGVLLLIAGWGLWRVAPWSRGPALITQLILLGLAWNVREHVVAAVAILVVALVVLAGVLHPDSIEALSGDTTDE